MDGHFVKIGSFFHPSTCPNSKKYNVNVYVSIIRQEQLPGQKHPPWPLGVENHTPNKAHLSNERGEMTTRSRCTGWALETSGQSSRLWDKCRGAPGIYTSNS